MKKILVPVDFSDHSKYAAEVAASIARKSKGRLYLCHVVDIPSYVDTTGPAFENIPEGIAALKVVKKKFKEFIKLPFLKDINLGEVIMFNSVYENIIDFTHKNDVDLIVMGSHGSSGFREFLIGSNTQKIVRVADCPVLTVKKRIEDFTVKNMVFASDFADDIKDVFFDFIKIARYFGAFIHFVKVITKENFEPTSQSKEMINAFVKEFDVDRYSYDVYNANNVEEGINEYAENIGAELISLATHGRSTFSQLFNESLTEQLVNHSDLPVLSIRV